ncbi:hypothetical protein KNP414_01440 [Paenibacillus mucilaginosus KNP414]|uniref:Uncharacterized protein n=1 Tax=Paenibacillus mucilaginosus (strain KNP414) TaxID=1036673 RepID=F8FL85_PAEMK|nr:hypothetical protein KNP414_01440 [Paenibacillus mucilaginosus KNP414]
MPYVYAAARRIIRLAAPEHKKAGEGNFPWPAAQLVMN